MRLVYRLISLFTGLMLVVGGVIAVQSPNLPPSKTGERRLALVIGNSNYRAMPNELQPLPNPVNDADDIANALKKLNFEVMLYKDADLDQMEDGIHAFSQKITTNDVALFFYAGHGMQVKGENYLIPVSAKFEREDQIERRAIKASAVLDKIEQAKTKLFFLDACRDNPFMSRGKRGAMRGGLAKMDAPSGTLLVYSTDPDNLAGDGKGRNSPFTESLLRHLADQGIEPVPRGNEFSIDDITEKDAQARAQWIPRQIAMADAYQKASSFKGSLDAQRAIWDRFLVTFAEDNPFTDDDNRLREQAKANRDTLIKQIDANKTEVKSAESSPGAAKEEKIPATKPNPTPPVSPATPSYSLDDLKNQQESRANWERWQKEMEKAYTDTQAFQGEPDLQRQAWDRFLSSYKQDNPFSKDDERLRELAKKNRGAIQKTKANTNEKQNSEESSPAPANSPAPVKRSFEPEMVAIPGGKFDMGSPAREEGREPGDAKEDPHQVRVGSFKMGKYEITVGQFRAFIAATGYQTDAEKNVGVNGCLTWSDSDGKFDWRAGRSWDSPEFSQTDRQPVVCVSWNDATAYVDWLNKETGKRYRLPTETEWEYAARGGTIAARYWGNDPNKACGYANVADQSQSPSGRTWTPKHECKDGYWFTAPVGSFKPNGFDLYDMLGNVWEWTCSEYQEHYNGSEKNCLSKNDITSRRSVRGGSLLNTPAWVRSAARSGLTPAYRGLDLGFRLAQD